MSESVCHWCKIPVVRHPTPIPNQRTKDHIKCRAQCRSRAEWMHPSNRVIACYACNQRRNQEFMATHCARASFGRKANRNGIRPAPAQARLIRFVLPVTHGSH